MLQGPDQPPLSGWQATEAERKGSSSGSAPEAVRLTTIKVLRERIRLLGIARSGAYEHYNYQLENDFPIPRGELQVLALIKQQLPDLRSYHEIGSGLATLPLMLAHEGLASVGIERDERRHLTAVAILRDMSVDLPQVEANCRLIGAAFPDAVADLDVSDSMAILTDFVSTQVAADYVKLCRRLAQYRYVLVDLQRFCTKRESAEDYERLVEELVSYGLTPRSEIIDLGGEGIFRLFEGGQPSERHSSALKAEALAASVTDAPKAAGTITRLPAEAPLVAGRTEIQLRPAAELAIREVTELAPVASALPPLPRRARSRRFGGWLGVSAFLVVGIPSILAIIYFVFIASNQYVTSLQFAVRGPSQANAGRTTGAAMMGPSAMSPDAFVVTDYINSQQAIADVERKVDVRSMFSRPEADFWARLPPAVTGEQMAKYWAHMVRAQFDLISGNVSVSVRAFTPQDSLSLARALIASSDEMFRKLNTQAQRDFMRVADENVARAQQQLAEARQALLAFRQKSGFVDPDKTANAGSAIVDELRKQLAQVHSQLAAVKAVSPNSPTLAALQSQMTALEAQIKSLDQLGSTTVRAVSAETLAQYQALDLERQFSEKQYTEAMSLRNQAHLMAQNQQSYLALFVEPALAETSLYPDRILSIVTVMLAAAATWFIGMLITYAVRDHLV